MEGIDASHPSIKTATKNSSDKIQFHFGDKQALEAIPRKFDIITSVMVFQFMKDFETYLPLFHNLLTERGLIIFAVHNPDFIKSCFRDKVIVKSMKNVGKTSVARMEIANGKIADTYVRSKDSYRTMFEKHGFDFLSSHYPPFTEEFVADYKWKLPTDNAEYLIMAMRKR